MNKKLPSQEIPESNMSEREQGLIINCLSCTIINNILDANCPECRGKKEYFLPMQMMDKFSSQKLIIDRINSLLNEKNNLFAKYLNNTPLDSDQIKVLSENSFNLLKVIIIYNFDLKELLVDTIKNLNIVKNK